MPSLSDLCGPKRKDTCKWRIGVIAVGSDLALLHGQMLFPVTCPYLHTYTFPPSQTLLGFLCDFGLCPSALSISEQYLSGLMERLQNKSFGSTWSRQHGTYLRNLPRSPRPVFPPPGDEAPRRHICPWHACESVYVCVCALSLAVSVTQLGGEFSGARTDWWGQGEVSS